MTRPRVSRVVMGVLAATLPVACEPLRLDPFLYDPLPEPPGGYNLSTAVIPRFEHLSIPTPDGERLHAVFVPSNGARRDVTLIYFHGQSNNVGSTWDRIELLFPLGYDLVVVDPRGYGRSTGTPSEPGIQIDLRAVHAFVTVRPDVSGDRLVYYGRSFGGALAIELATAAAPAVLVTESAFTSVAALVADGTYVDFPRSFVAASAWDNLTKIRGIKSPALILHGTADPYVQFKYARQLAATHPGTHELIAVEGADHGNVPQHLGPEAYRATIAAFVERVR